MPQKRQFTKAARQKPPEPKTELHYLWINETPDNGKREALCSIPLTAIDKAMDNAERYPHVPVSLWVDMALIDDLTRTMLISHIYIRDLKNFSVRNLKELPDYNGDPEVFDPMLPNNMGWTCANKNGTSIWGRVDYARLLVLRHSLQQGADYVLYSDLDNADVKLCDKDLLRKLKYYGAVFGRVFKGSNFLGDNWIFENGFMGFTQQGVSLACLSQLIEKTREHILKKDNGYGPYRTMIGKFAKIKGINQAQLGYECGCPFMGTELPANPVYVEIGLNDP